jgi:hypothetical protein
VNFTHDFNPGNGPAVSPVDSGNGFGARVFWTAVIPDSDVQVNLGAGIAEMHVHNFPELDYYSPEGLGDLASLGPTWQTGYFDSTVSINVVWSGPVTRRVDVRDAANGFAGTFNENQATVTWSASSDSGFSFTSDVGSFATSVPEVPGVNGVTVPLNFFAQVAQERNGVFFPAGRANGEASSPVALASSVLSAVEEGNASAPHWTVSGAQGQTSEFSVALPAAERHVLRSSQVVVAGKVLEHAVPTQTPDHIFANWDGRLGADGLGEGPADSWV